MGETAIVLHGMFLKSSTCMRVQPAANKLEHNEQMARKMAGTLLMKRSGDENETAIITGRPTLQFRR